MDAFVSFLESSGGCFKACHERPRVGGGKVRFAGLLMRLAVADLVGAARETGAGCAAELTGVNVYLEAG